jgi:hypothetical protein
LCVPDLDLDLDLDQVASGDAIINETAALGAPRLVRTAGAK